MAYTSICKVAENAVADRGFGDRDLYTVYECINILAFGSRGVYWTLSFDPSHDDMDSDPLVYEYVKVWNRSGDVEHKIGDLVAAIDMRDSARRTLHAKFDTAFVDTYVDCFDSQFGLLEWTNQYLDRDTGQLRRDELIADALLLAELLSIDNTPSYPQTKKVRQDE